MVFDKQKANWTSEEVHDFVVLIFAHFNESYYILWSVNILFMIELFLYYLLVSVMLNDWNIFLSYNIRQIIYHAQCITLHLNSSLFTPVALQYWWNIFLVSKQYLIFPYINYTFSVLYYLQYVQTFHKSYYYKVKVASSQRIFNIKGHNA